MAVEVKWVRGILIEDDGEELGTCAGATIDTGKIFCYHMALIVWAEL